MNDIAPLFSIIIVNFNSGNLLENCISSVKKHIPSGYEIIVYDNASTDDSIVKVQTRFPEDPVVKIILGNQNLGFAKANNAVVRCASGQYLHFLNPDTLVNPQLRTDYENIAREQDESVYVTSLIDENGQALENKYLIPRLNNYLFRIFRKERAGYWNIGASLIIRRDVFEKVGGWSEDYFMYAEDLDFFYTLYKHHIPVRYLDTKIVHIGKGTTRKVWTESQRALTIELSFKKFYRKHGFPLEYYAIRPILLCYILFHDSGEFLLSLKTFILASFIRTK